MKQFFKELYGYNHHFNQKLYAVFIDNPKQTSDKSIKLYNHILNAHQIWNDRINRKQITSGVWELHAIEELKNMDQVNYEQTLQIIDRFDLNEIVNFSLRNGKSFKKEIYKILFHTINHSTYHKGQIATEFRQEGLEPLLTDYIIYDH